MNHRDRGIRAGAIIVPTFIGLDSPSTGMMLNEGVLTSLYDKPKEFSVSDRGNRGGDEVICELPNDKEISANAHRLQGTNTRSRN